MNRNQHLCSAERQRTGISWR